MQYTTQEGLYRLPLYLVPMELKKIVKKFGHSAHIVLPIELIDKEVTITTDDVYTQPKNVYTSNQKYIHNKPNVYTSKLPNKPIVPKQDTDVSPEERAWIDKYSSANSSMKIFYKIEAAKKFYPERVKFLLSLAK